MTNRYLPTACFEIDIARKPIFVIIVLKFKFLSILPS